MKIMNERIKSKRKGKKWIISTQIIAWPIFKFKNTDENSYINHSTYASSCRAARCL